MAKKIADTKKMTHEEWLELRKSSIGGSDAGAVAGMNQYSSPLTVYADKKGLSKPKETSEAMRLGTDLEQYVAERFMEKTGKKVRNDFFMYADDDYDFMTANIDRRIIGENAGLECKTMGSFNGYNLEDGEIPSHYYAQVQHYMMVMGFDRMYMAILVFQRGVYVIEVERDDEFIESLREAERLFWENNIVKDRMPDPDGSDASIATLKELYPEAKPKTEIAIPGLDVFVADYKAYTALAKQYQQQADEAKAKICAKMGDNEIAVGDKYRCTWRNQSKTGVTAKKLKEKYPAIYAELAEVSSYRTFRVGNL